MKKILAILMAMLLLPAFALAETTFDGVVVAGDAVSVTAPFGGTVSNFRLRAGSLISLGDEIATIETGKVYANHMAKTLHTDHATLVQRLAPSDILVCYDGMEIEI